MQQSANNLVKNCLGVVLAGGLSRRMGGQNKAGIQLMGRPLVEHSVSRLKKQTKDVIINANEDLDIFNNISVPVVADDISGFAGPLVGILTGMKWAREHTPDMQFVATVACDTPFFPENFVEQCLLKNKHENSTIVLASSNNRTHPVFGIWPIALLEDLENWLINQETRKVLAWVDRHKMEEVSFQMIELDGKILDPFFNINTPDELAFAENLLAKVDV